ncbi:MAG: hypothetical protein WBF90_13095 [Rivularia sp. (in: cyanobacteria)]
MNQDIRSFLEKNACFMGSVRADSLLFWYATVVDLFAFSKEFDFSSTKLIVQEVTQDAPKSELCSKKLLAVID